MKILVRILVITVSVLLIEKIMKSVNIDSNTTAFWVALVLAGLNFFIKPVLQILTLPITILTLGLFNLIINAGMILITAKIVDGFVVDGWWAAILFSILLSIVSTILNSLIE